MKTTLFIITVVSLLLISGCSSVASNTKPTVETTAPESTEVTEPKLGSRENPYAIGQTISLSDWDITVNSFNPNATAEVAAYNVNFPELNDGRNLAMMNVTYTYKGNGSGFTNDFLYDFVTDEGNVLVGMSLASPPPPAADYQELFTGASITGNVVFEIPNTSGSLRILSLTSDDDGLFVRVIG